jgi:hypothetical protein
MHDLKAEHFFGPEMVDHVTAGGDGSMKTLGLCGINDDPPCLQDGRLLTLDETVEFFRLILTAKLHSGNSGGRPRSLFARQHPVGRTRSMAGRPFAATRTVGMARAGPRGRRRSRIAALPFPLRQERHIRANSVTAMKVWPATLSAFAVKCRGHGLPGAREAGAGMPSATKPSGICQWISTVALSFA